MALRQGFQFEPLKYIHEYIQISSSLKPQVLAVETRYAARPDGTFPSLFK